MSDNGCVIKTLGNEYISGQIKGETSLIPAPYKELKLMTDSKHTSGGKESDFWGKNSDERGDLWQRLIVNSRKFQLRGSLTRALMRGLNHYEIFGKTELESFVGNALQEDIPSALVLGNFRVFGTEYCVTFYRRQEAPIFGLRNVSETIVQPLVSLYSLDVLGGVSGMNQVSYGPSVVTLPVCRKADVHGIQTIFDLEFARQEQ